MCLFSGITFNTVKELRHPGQEAKASGYVSYWIYGEFPCTFPGAASTSSKFKALRSWIINTDTLVFFHTCSFIWFFEFSALCSESKPFILWKSREERSDIILSLGKSTPLLWGIILHNMAHLWAFLLLLDPWFCFRPTEGMLAKSGIAGFQPGAEHNINIKPTTSDWTISR